MLDLSASTRKSPYFAKDAAKARRATKFIGRGSAQSSTNAYARALPPHLVNAGRYDSSDIVFVSAEGARSARLAPDLAELGRAAAAGASFITDVPHDRERSYNIGERQVATHLVSLGYHEAEPGLWRPRPARPAIATGDLDFPAPNHLHHDRRGFLPK